MSRINTNPITGVEEMVDRMRTQLDEAATPWEGGEAAGVGEPTMAADVADTGDEFVVTVDVPGVELDDISVRLADHKLVVKAKRKETAGDRELEYLQRERQYRRLSRAIPIPEDVVADEVTAKLRSGVLRITLPKVEPTSEGRVVPIE